MSVPCLAPIKMEPEEDERALPAFQSSVSTAHCPLSLPSRSQVAETATNIREVYNSTEGVSVSINNLLGRLTTVAAEPVNPAIVWTYSSEILSNLEKLEGDWTDELKRMINDFLKIFLDNISDHTMLKQFQFHLRGLSRKESFKKSCLFCTARYRIAQRLEWISLEAKEATLTAKKSSKKKTTSAKKSSKKKKLAKKKMFNNRKGGRKAAAICRVQDLVYHMIKQEAGSDEIEQQESEKEESEEKDDSEDDVIYTDDDIVDEVPTDLDEYAPNSLRILQLFYQNLDSAQLTTGEHVEFLNFYLNSLAKAAINCNNGPITELIKEKIAKTLAQLFGLSFSGNPEFIN